MDTLHVILETASQRAREIGLPYAGCLTPSEAYAVMTLTAAAKLVDVRTRPELEFVGRIPGALHIEWAFYPGMTPNPDFLAQLDKQVDTEALTMFICRSGARSSQAAIAATQAGYASCYNVLEGFEGNTDAKSGQRGTTDGWKAAGLPWVS